MAMKTHKAMSKRVRITRTGKVIKRKAGQGHFNSRESGNTTRNKRSDVSFGVTIRRALKAMMPYNLS
ncbi:MAG: 50S ribosomal protein L35 [Patescibacteria group bacterium]